MDAGNSKGKRERQLPNLDALDPQALKALVLAQQSELDSRETEIENLKLLILKLKRMHFGPRAEKFDRDIKQLELRLEDLEAAAWVVCGKRVAPGVKFYLGAASAWVQQEAERRGVWQTLLDAGATFFPCKTRAAASRSSTLEFTQEIR